MLIKLINWVSIKITYKKPFGNLKENTELVEYILFNSSIFYDLYEVSKIEIKNSVLCEYDSLTPHKIKPSVL